MASWVNIYAFYHHLSSHREETSTLLHAYQSLGTDNCTESIHSSRKRPHTGQQRAFETKWTRYLGKKSIKYSRSPKLRNNIPCIAQIISYPPNFSPKMQHKEDPSCKIPKSRKESLRVKFWSEYKEDCFCDIRAKIRPNSTIRRELTARSRLVNTIEVLQCFFARFQHRFDLWFCKIHGEAVSADVEAI